MGESRKKEKFSSAIKKDKRRCVFPCGKKEPVILRLRKASAVESQRKVVLAPFCHCKSKKFKVYYDVVIF